MKNTLEKSGIKGKVRSIHHKRFDIEELENKQIKINEDIFSNDFTTFDDKGFIRSRKNIENDINIRYDLDKNEYTTSSYNEDDQLVESGTGVFNDNGDDLKYITFDSNGFLDKERIYRYNRMGYLVMEVCYDSEGNINEYVTNQYDIHGNLRCSRFYIKEDEWCVKKYRYSLNEDLIEDLIELNVKYHKNECPSYTIKYEYDKNHNIVKQEFLDEFLLVTDHYSLTWLFDKNNNWTRKTAFKKGKRVWFEERIIEYYTS